MVEQIQVTGMVVSSMPVGEYDNRIVIITKECGKITVFAKGARRQNSPFMAGSRPFSFGQFTVYAGRNSYGLISLNIENYFTELITNFDAAYMGFYFLEIAEYFGHEGIDGSETINLLYASFNAMIKNKIPIDLIRSIYELKTMAINGVYPNVFECAVCKKKEDIIWYDEGSEHMLCDACRTHGHNVLKINPSVVYAMQFIISSPISKIYSFSLKPELINEIRKITYNFIKRHTERRFKSLEIIENLK